MAGFLRKKTKQPEPAPKGLPSVSLSSPGPPTPLFARFATNAQSNNNVSPRIVSSPMSLARKEQTPKGGGGAGRGNNHFGASSLAAGSREAEMARRRVQDQAQASQASLNRHPIVDKPLPSPVGNDYSSPPLSTAAAPPAVNRRMNSNRGPGPPPTFHTQQHQGMWSRASLDSRDRESKPLPRPGSAQASYSSPERQAPPSGYNFTPAVPPKRKVSVSSVNTAVTPQIGPPITNAYRKVQPPLPPDEGFPSQGPLPQTSKRAQDFHSDAPNGAEGGQSNLRVSQQTLPEMYSTPMSDRALDLPPEFALFQEYSDAISDNGAPNSSSTHPRPPSSLKVTDLVPGSSTARSGPENLRDLGRRPSIPQLGANNAHVQPSPSPPLPPPPADMGITTSHVVSSDFLSSSSYKADFHAPRVLTSNVRSPPYSSTNDVNQQSQPSHLPVRANSRSMSPPLPPGAALPSNFHPFHVRNPQDAAFSSHFAHSSPPPPPPAKLQSQSFQEQFYPASVLQQSPNGPSHVRPHQPIQVPVAPLSVRKSSSVRNATTPLQGKPRIFAAMEAQESETEQPAIQPSPSPPPPPSSLPEYPPHHHVLTKPYHEATSSPQIQHHYLQHQHRQSQSQSQPHPQPLLPAAEFSTPKSHFDPLPHETAERSSPPFSMVPPEQNQPQEPVRTPRSNSHRSLSRNDDPSRQQPPPQLLSPQNTPRSRKLSKPRNANHASDANAFMHPNGSNVTIPGTPEKGQQHHHRTVGKPHLQSSISSQKSSISHSTTNLNLNTFEPVVQVDEDTIRKAGIPLDDDPFARVEGVKMMKPTTPPPAAKEGKSRGTKGSLKEKERERERQGDDVGQGQLAGLQQQEGKTPLTPVSPEEYRKSRKERGGAKSDASPPATVVDMIVQQQQNGKGQESEEPRDPITLVQFLSDPTLLSTLLAFLSFYDWCVLVAVSKEIRILLVRTKELREVVLERYLRTVGYSRWMWDDPEPLSLSLQDLGDYMRGVSTPTHEYSRVAAMHVHSLTIHPNHRDPSLAETVRSLTAATRAYTRVLLRLRAQAEKEASIQQSQPPPTAPSPINGRGANGNFSPARPGAGSASRVSSRAPSPTTSSNSHYYHNASAMNSNVNVNSTAVQASSSQTNLTFRSPLFRLRRAPLLRVFVPSPGGDWLSDRSVLECEAECKRAGILHLLRFGDVVWDVAVGDEGNVGRLVWDGSFLIDLDYTYSAIGDLPKYLPTLAFPPSYFHRVIRTGANNSNPIVHIDIKPWGEEIAMNLQLLQDRVRTETPQGAFHNVVRWVHRSSFSIRPPRGPQRYNHSTRGPPANGRIPIPESNNLFIDPGWYGTIVVETEGTNEALADLQERCGPGAFPPRARGVNHHVTQAQVENRRVFRILREKSRPGEIWLKAVGVKERLL